MFINYLKTTLRVLLRDKAYTTINILGLSLGIACCLILGVYLQGELSYDQHHQDYERVHRVVHQISTTASTEISPLTSRSLGPLLTQDYPEIESFLRLRPAFSLPMLFSSEDRASYWDNVMIADENVFDFLNHEIIAGNPQTALLDPNSIAISQSFAQSYFGEEDALGKFVNSSSSSFRVSLVFADLPENSHLDYDVLLPYRLYYGSSADNAISQAKLWDPSVYTYLLLPTNYDANNFRATSKDVWDRYMSERGAELGTTIEFQLERIDSIHLESKTVGSGSMANRYYVYTFFAIGIFILLIASTNYINLAIARSIARGKEVGIRKIVGASKAQLVAVFMVESILFTFVGLALGLALAELILTVTPISSLLGRSLSLAIWLNPTMILLLLLAGLCFGVIAGLYPALFIYKTFTMQGLTGKGRIGSDNGIVSRGLVLLQLTISLGVIASTLLMMQQLRYIESFPMGFEKDNKIIVRLQGADIIEQLPVIENELSQFPASLGSTIGMELPGQMQDSLYLYDVENSEGEFIPQLFRGFRMGDRYLDVMGMEIVAGNDFGVVPASSTMLPVIVNEETVRRMDWNQPIGKRLERNGSFLQVIGVVNDFNFQDLRTGIDPLLISHDEADFSNWEQRERPLAFRWLFVDFVEGELDSTIGFLSTLLTRLDPVHPFQYELLEDSLNSVYGSQRNQLKLIGAFTLICILISCLGLLGLSSFSVRQRTKEIGIRKVLGATVLNIIFLLFRNILPSIVVAALLGSLLSYLAVGEWLQSFAYRANIDPLSFVLSAIIVLTVSFVTVASQSYRTVQANPIEALRYE